jgi:hypothetical protein
MGWITYHRPAGQTDREHFTAELINPNEREILDCATVKNVFYAAVQDKKDGQVWALVVLIQRTRGYQNFGYKDMDETVGPCYYDCPARILDLLTDTESEYAKQWRESCRKTIAAKAEARSSTVKVTDGTVIKLAKPLHFQGGYEAQEFKLRVIGRARRWVGNPGTDRQFTCRLPQDWATRYSWEKMSA